MTILVKQFIESNIELIEDEDYYDDLYDQAYEWMTDSQTEELTKILTETLDVNFETYAKENIIKHLKIEINNFIADMRLDLSLASFVRLYMNHINGLDWDEFQMLVEKELKNSKLVSTYATYGGDLHIKRRTK